MNIELEIKRRISPVGSEKIIGDPVGNASVQVQFLIDTHRRNRILIGNVLSIMEIKLIAAYWGDEKSTYRQIGRNFGISGATVHRTLKKSMGEVYDNSAQVIKDRYPRDLIIQGKREITSETRKRLSDARKQELNPFFGKHHSRKSKEKMRIAKLGKPSPKRGKKLSDTARANMSNAHQGKKLSSAHRENMKIAQRTRRRIEKLLSTV